jgi:outer membrane protein TolC
VPAPEPGAAKAAPAVINQSLGQRDDSQGNPGQGHRASAAEAPPPVRLSLLDAIRYSIEGNHDIRVVSFAPQQAQEELTSAKSVYDPSVFAEGSYRRQPDLTTSVDNIGFCRPRGQTKVPQHLLTHRRAQAAAAEEYR